MTTINMNIVLFFFFQYLRYSLKLNFSPVCHLIGHREKISNIEKSISYHIRGKTYKQESHENKT